MSEQGKDVEAVLWAMRREALIGDITKRVKAVVGLVVADVLEQHMEALQLLHQEASPATTPQEAFERDLLHPSRRVGGEFVEELGEDLDEGLEPPDLDEERVEPLYRFSIHPGGW